MAQNAEDINALPQEQNVITKELLETAIKSKERCNDILVKSFTVKEGCGKGENYSSIAFAVNVLTIEDGVDKVHNLFIKTVHSNELIREHSLRKSKVFVRESMMYSQVIPDMTNYQNDLGVNIFGPATPPYYYSLVDDKNGIIILEDVRPYGYVLGDRLNGLDFEHCVAAIKELAVFHALSLGLKNRNPSGFNKYEHLVRDSLFGSSMPAFLSQNVNLSVKLVQEISDDKNLKQRVESLKELDLQTFFADILKPDEPYMVICHGDMWCNNMLFRYEEGINGKKVTDVMLVDLQVSRYASPVTDLSYFLFMSTTKTLRKKHLNDILRVYHSAFMESLTKLNLEFEEFTFSTLENLFKQKMMFGVVFACIMLPGVLAKPENVEGSVGTTEDDFVKYVTNMSKEIAKEENLPIVKERLLGALEDAVAMGAL